MITRPSLVRSCGTLAGLLWAAAACAGATYTVTTIPDLQAQIAIAVPGDVIVLQNGLYTTTAAIAVAAVGTAAEPIRIVAETPGAVAITGTHGFTVNSPAAYVSIEGFTLTHRAGRNSIRSGATHIRFTRNIFESTGDGAYLTVAGHDAEIDRNEFRNKHTVGNMIDVRGSGSQIAQRVWIHHNYFHDFDATGVNGGETIRFGLSGLSLSNGFGVIEYNLFVRCTGENELISNKSSANTYRYNTILDSPGAQLTLRHGNDCLVYGNYLHNTDGIRIFGDRHRIFSNVLAGNRIGINIGNGDGEVADGAPLTSHDRPDGCVISFNALVDNETHYLMSGRTNGLGATDTTFANNVITRGGVVADIRGPYPGAVWRGNLLVNAGDPGDMPPGGYTSVNWP